MEFMKVITHANYFVWVCFYGFPFAGRFQLELNGIVFGNLLGIAIGGDVFPGSTLSDHVLRFNNIPQVYYCSHVFYV